MTLLLEVEKYPSYNKALDVIADMLDDMQDGSYFEQ